MGFAKKAVWAALGVALVMVALAPTVEAGRGRLARRARPRVAYLHPDRPRLQPQSVLPKTMPGRPQAVEALGIGQVTYSRAPTWITDYGAYPGGSAEDNDAAIAACKTALMAAGQYEMFVPAGMYAISEMIELPRGMTIRGVSAGSASFGEVQGSILDMADDMAEPAISALARCRIQDLLIIGHTTAGQGASGSVGVQYVGDGSGGSDLSFPNGYVIDNVAVRNAETGFKFSWGGAASIRSCEAWDCEDGFRITGSQNNSLNFYGCRALRSRANGVLCDASLVNQLSFFGGTFEQTTGYGIQLSSATDGIRNVRIEGVYFERNSVADVYCTSSLPGVENLRAVGNWHYDFGDCAYKIDRCDHGVIEGHHFQVDTLGSKKSVRLGASARFMRIGVSRHRPSGSALASTQLGEDLGQNNWWDPTPRNWNVNGDGTTDVTAQLELWLAGHPQPHLPQGVYVVSDELSTLVDQTLTGDGQNKALLKAAAGYTGRILRVQDRVTVRDIGLQGVDAAGSIGIEPAASSFGWTLQRVQARNFESGLKIDNANAAWNVLNCYFRLNTHGILISSASGTPERGTIRDSQFSENSTGIRASGGARALTIAGNDFLNGAVYGVYFDGVVQGALIAGNRGKNNGTADFRLAGASRGINATANECDGSPTSFILSCTDSVFAANFLNPGGMSPTTLSISGGSIDNDFGPNRISSGSPANGPALVSATRNTYLGKYYGNAAPSAGDWLTGDIVWDISPTSGDPAFYQCSAAGTPGTWKDGPDVP